MVAVVQGQGVGVVRQPAQVPSGRRLCRASARRGPSGWAATKSAATSMQERRASAARSSSRLTSFLGSRRGSGGPTGAEGGGAPRRPGYGCAAGGEFDGRGAQRAGAAEGGAEGGREEDAAAQARRIAARGSWNARVRDVVCGSDSLFGDPAGRWSGRHEFPSRGLSDRDSCDAWRSSAPAVTGVQELSGNARSTVARKDQFPCRSRGTSLSDRMKGFRDMRGERR